MRSWIGLLRRGSLGVRGLGGWGVRRDSGLGRYDGGGGEGRGGVGGLM
jgi:hypothetical protein